MSAAGTYGSTVFCDDIRDEVGGKKTLLGCYLDTLVGQQPFPLILPTFAFRIVFVEPYEEAEGPLQLRIAFEPESGEEVTVMEVELPEDRRSQAAGEDDPKSLTSIMAFRASPFRIDQPGKLKVRAYKNGEKFRLGALRVVAQGDAEEPHELPLEGKIHLGIAPAN